MASDITGVARRMARAARWCEVTEFGSNPGGLRMFSFVPANLPRKPALVVVLHGCGQTAAGYDLGAGWSTLAKRYGFALLMPEQQSANNANTCFNWFNPEDISRDQRRSRLDPADDRADGRRSRHRSAPHLRHRAFRRRRHDLGDARDLSGSVRRRRRHRRPAVRHCQQCARSAERHDAVAVAPGARTGRSRAQRFRRTRARGRNCRSGTAAPTAPSIRPMPTRSSSSGSTCTGCRRRRCRRRTSTAIRARSGGMPTARPSSNPTPSPTWPTARRSASPAMTSAMARKARS